MNVYYLTTICGYNLGLDYVYHRIFNTDAKRLHADDQLCLSKKVKGTVCIRRQVYNMQ